MPGSSFVFEQGDPILVGTHGQTDFVFAGGEEVTNSGTSDFVFEGGVGLGGAEVTFTVFDSTGSEIVSLGPVEANTVYGEEIQLTTNHSGTQSSFDGFWDYIQVERDGSTLLVDSFDDGDLSEYSTSTGPDASIGVSSAQSFDGTEALRVDAKDGSAGSAVSTSGLPNYPQVGDTITARTFWTNGNLADHSLSFGYQDNNNRYVVRLDSRDDEGGNSVARIEQFDNGNLTLLAETDTFEMENYENEWLKLEVVWD